MLIGQTNIQLITSHSVPFHPWFPILKGQYCLNFKSQVWTQFMIDYHGNFKVQESCMACISLKNDNVLLLSKWRSCRFVIHESPNAAEFLPLRTSKKSRYLCKKNDVKNTLTSSFWSVPYASDIWWIHMGPKGVVIPWFFYFLFFG